MNVITHALLWSCAVGFFLLSHCRVCRYRESCCCLAYLACCGVCRRDTKVWQRRWDAGLGVLVVLVFGAGCCCFSAEREGVSTQRTTDVHGVRSGSSDTRVQGSPTVGRENFARFKFRVFCNSRKFIRESLFRKSLFANRNDRYTAIIAAKQ